MSSNPFPEIVLEVSEFVELFNQTLSYAYPTVTIRGELSNYKVSQNKWIFFDLKDKNSTIRFFGSTYNLPNPLEEGMLLRVQGVPRLHPKYGFSITISNIQPEGEGTIRRAAELLKMKLNTEGLFDEERKRTLLYPPLKLGLITSVESAAYIDFVKVLAARWAGLEIECADVQVQGVDAPNRIVSAIDYFNQKSAPPDVLVLTRGGGSPDDLLAFNTEQVTRAVASSRVPTLVAIGHERDLSLAEMVADQRASTPSNAAEILVPDKNEILGQIKLLSIHLYNQLHSIAHQNRQQLLTYKINLNQSLLIIVKHSREQLYAYQRLIEALNPRLILKRGFSIVRLVSSKSIVKTKSDVQIGDIVDIELATGHIKASVK